MYLYIPENKGTNTRLAISRIVHGYKDLYAGLFESGSKDGSGSCEKDVACYPEWETESNAVALVLLASGTEHCSGSLLNNTAQDFKAYFLTAFHCVDVNENNLISPAEENNAENWAFRFKYKKTSCSGSIVASFYTYNQDYIRAAWNTSDFALVELQDSPIKDVAFLGWDRTGSTPTKGTGIHHPSGDVMKISFDNDVLKETSKSSNSGSGYWRTIWDVGATEPGSSDSPLFDQNKRVVGQLWGGYSACGASDMRDWYGCLYRSWTGGGTNSTRLSNWLDPNNTGAQVLNTLYPYITGPTVVCTSNSTFTLHNRPSGTTVNWTKSTNLRPVSGQGTDNYTVKAYWYSAGQGWVRATIGGAYYEKHAWVGKPTTDDLDILNPYNFPANTLCEGEQNQLIGNYSYNTGWLQPTIQDYDWDYGGWSHFEVGATDNISFVTVPYPFTYKDIKLRAANQCGESDWITERFYPNQSCGYFFGFSPNPADDYVEISPDESKLAENAIDYYEVRIYNSLNVAVFQTGKTKESLLRINTKQFQNGVYFIHFIAGKKIDVKQLVVNH
ncbi:MAG: trypsin-like peptidase domain-containing protein [Bacteroidetes bacterium]|nr:trypsin-like peptidase domain-containing protein [Bacteroidota bacterium]